MKKFSEAVLAKHKHMALKASPYHAHSMGLVYTPKGGEQLRPIDTADAGYGGEAVADAEGGEANAGMASKKAVSPMAMPTLVKPGLDKAKLKKVKEGFDSSPADIAKMLVAKHGKNVTKDHIKALEQDRDSHSGLDHDEIMQHVKKLQEETERERLMRLRSFAWQQKRKGLGADIHQPVSEEQIDELKKKTLASYAKKATDDATFHSFVAGSLSSKDPQRLVHDKIAMKRQTGVIKAVDRLAKEEVELDERNMENKAKKDNVVRQVGTHAYIKHGADAGSPKMTGRKVMSDPKFKSSKIADMYRKLPSMEEATGVTDYNPKSQGGTRAELLQKLAKSKSPEHATAARKAGATQSELKAAMMKEENDGTEADAGEYGYEGDMAMTQLKSIIRNAKELHDHMQPQTDLPEWLQSKITLAADYIQTAADYWKSEKEEAMTEGKMKDIATDKEETERLKARETLGGEVKKMPEGPKGKLPLGFRLARSAAKKAAKSVSEEEKKSKVPRVGEMEKALEEEQIDELMGQDLRSQQAKQNDDHFKKQPPRMQAAIKFHLKNKKPYRDAVAAAEKDVATMHEEVWDKPMPDSKKQGSLSPEQKAKAKARAERAGRSYPNMIDNMWASKQ